MGQSSTDVKVCIGTLEELHTLMGGYKRHTIYMEEIEKLGLPRLQMQRTDTTRQWSSAERAVSAYLRVLPAVLNTLDRCATSDMDSATVITACGLKKKLTEFAFILSVHVIHEIVTETGPVSRQLQAADCDILKATTLIKSVLCKFSLMRQAGDTKWLELLEKTKTFCTEHGLPTGQRQLRKSPKAEEDGWRDRKR